MADSKSEVTTRTGSTEVTNLYEIATQNCIRILDELAKAHPQYTQSISNLQYDYVLGKEYYPDYGLRSKDVSEYHELSYSNTTIHR